MASIIFNELNAHFQKKIYASFKGKLRLMVLAQDFAQLNLHQQPLRILDIGAGEGQWALALAKQGHNLTLVEPAAIMLNEAQRAFTQENLKAEFFNAPIAALEDLALAPFDLILCHAVLEWLEDPYAALERIHTQLKPEGYLSLLFYNRDGLILHNLIRGNFIAAQKKHQGGYPGGLTPITPIDPNNMAAFLKCHQLALVHESGIRVFHDYMTKANQEKISEDERLALELQFSTHPSYIRSARYLHWMVKHSAQS